MFRYLLLCTFLLSAHLNAQTTAEREILNRLPPAPLNGRGQAPANPAEKTFQLVPDPGSAPVALFSRNDRPFIGAFSGPTTITIEKQCLLFKDDKLPNQVCMALPDGFDLLQDVFQANTDLRAYSGLEGKDEHLYFTEGKKVSLAYHFEVTDEEQTIKFPDLPIVRQKQVRNDQQVDFQAVPAIIETDEGEEELKPGNIQSIRFKGATYRVFLHTSIRQSNAGSCGGNGYILRIIYLKDLRA